MLPMKKYRQRIYYTEADPSLYAKIKDLVSF